MNRLFVVLDPRVTHPVIGGNVSMVVLRSMFVEGFQVYTKECITLVEKSLVFNYNLEIFTVYACVEYFLLFLTTGKWWVKILLRRYTGSFLRKLAQGEYACWRDYFLY